ncbi:MAG: (d)CMP kinase, partial [Pseudomonadota bacterium]
EFEASGESLTLDTMIASLEERDARDRNRPNAPMAKAADADLIDTSRLSIDAAVERACAIIDAARARKETP